MFYRNSFQPFSFFSIFLPLIVSFVFVDLILRGVALWKSARFSQKGWFIALLIVNSLGILPVIYLLFFQKKRKV